MLLVLCAPLYLGVAIWLRAKSAGPVFFRHTRIGRSGKSFGAWKFRTMVPDSACVLEEYLSTNPSAKAEWEQYHKLKNDPRVIPGIGDVLRRTSLDELPQLWNVLAGHMSLVGPRPVYTIDEIRMYGELYPLYLRIRPGLTGLWQVSGRSERTYQERVRLDLEYVSRQSLALDVRILLRTPWALLSGRGAA